jgi:hypothetical protein
MDFVEAILKKVELLANSQKQDEADSHFSFVRWCTIHDLLEVLFSVDFEQKKYRPRFLQLATAMPFSLQKKRLLLLAGEPYEKVFT